MKELQVTLKTLTPLWTGGVDGKCDRLHETGLIGSLRWWYEALVRGLGGQACDPSKHECSFDIDKYRKSKATDEHQRLHEAGLCDVCQVFGATGWRRRFRLAVDDTTRPAGVTGSQQPTDDRFKRKKKPDDKNKHPSWYFGGLGRGGIFKITVIPLSPDFNPQLVLGLLKLAEKHTGLGAKTQLGYGWFQLQNPPGFDANAFVNALQSAAVVQSKLDIHLPQLYEMFFAQVKVTDAALTATLNLKYDVRAAFRNTFPGNQMLRHFVCGVARGQERQAAKVHFSQAIDGVMRVWGWIPANIPVSSVNREAVMEMIYKTIIGFGTLQDWREYDSSRDTVQSHQTDKTAFLLSLLQS